MTRRPLAHCKKHQEHDLECPECLRLDEALARSWAVVHGRPTRHRRDVSEGPARNLEDWAQCMVESMRARVAAAEAAAKEPTEDTP